MEVPALLFDLNTAYGLDLPETATIEMLETILAARINTLIMDDFNRLVQLLYRIDVNEQSLRQLLKQDAETDSGRLIALLILERSWKKVLTRRMYSSEIHRQKDQPNADESNPRK